MADIVIVDFRKPHIGPVDGWVRGLLADDAAGGFRAVPAAGGKPVIVLQSNQLCAGVGQQQR